MKRSISVLLLVTIMTVTAVAEYAHVGPTSIRITPPAPVFSDAERQAELGRRRAAVAEKMAPDSTMVLFSGQPRQYAGDVDYVFRQENNLYYLTNLKQPNATLVIRKSAGNVTESVYIPRPDPRRETWEGKMYSLQEAARVSGVKAIADAETLPSILEPIVSNTAAGSVTYLLLPDSDDDTDGSREFHQEVAFAKRLTGGKVVNAQPIFAELRLIKSPYELKLLQHAIDISIEAHMRSWATVGSASMEYEVQAEVEYTFRRRNADFWGYPSIVGCGPNATTLHYVESQGPVKKGQLLLMDVGAEYDHLTADVTRTFPVNGKFTKEQAEIYQIVYDAQEAAAKATKPGASMSTISRASDAVLRDGLFRLGLITDKNSGQLRVWYMHGLGHWLGMNVHDVGGRDVKFKPGMTFTNEPGIYIREDALNNLPDTPEWNTFKSKVQPVFEKYKNIGVRIEDDMLVTPSGVEWMTRALPRSIADIEAFMAAQPPTRAGVVGLFDYTIGNRYLSRAGHSHRQ